MTVAFPQHLQIDDSYSIYLCGVLEDCLDETNYAQVFCSLADIIRTDMDAMLKDGEDSEEQLEHLQNLADSLEALAEQCIKHSETALGG